MGSIEKILELSERITEIDEETRRLSERRVEKTRELDDLVQKYAEGLKDVIDTAVSSRDYKTLAAIGASQQDSGLAKSASEKKIPTKERKGTVSVEKGVYDPAALVQKGFKYIADKYKVGGEIDTQALKEATGIGPRNLGVVYAAIGLSRGEVKVGSRRIYTKKEIKEVYDRIAKEHMLLVRHVADALNQKEKVFASELTGRFEKDEGILTRALNVYAPLMGWNIGKDENRRTFYTKQLDL